MASNVPRFASFRPKPKAAPDPPTEPQTRPENRTERPKEHRRDEKRRSPVPKRAKVEKEIPSSKAYFSDRRGDPDIVRYGCLNRYDIPAYRRYGYGCVLGLDPSLKIDRERSSETKIYITSATRRPQERLLVGKHVAKDSDRALRFIKANIQQTQQKDLDFIAIPSNRKRKRDGSDIDEDDDATPIQDYRDIGASSEPSLADPDTQYDSETEIASASSEITKKNSELLRRTREAPEDVKAWLDFINHQEAMLLLDRPTDVLNDATRHQLADVRIPIYEEALKKASNDPKSHLALYKGLMKEAPRSWNDAKLAQKFKDVLGKHPGSTEMWFMYLDFVQPAFTRFKYEACRTAYLECLETIQSDATCTAETVLHVLIRMTSLIHGSGYQELALAIWQAILEYHAPRHDSAATLSGESLSDFEEFWDSEAPRIGEPNAKGWQIEVAPEIPAASEPLRSRNTSDTVFQDFREREKDAIAKLRYPGRTSDDLGEDDAFHTVFYTDIEVYLKCIPAKASYTLIVEAFLCSIGLPPPPTIAVYQRAWWNDPYLQHVVPRSASAHNYQDESDAFDAKINKFTACSVDHCIVTSELLFRHDFPLDRVRLNKNFVQRLLRLVVDTVPTTNDVFGEYLLAFELRHFPSEVGKTAKQLLKTRPSSQRLYHAYGLVEWHRGNSAKAAQVFSMSLSLDTASSITPPETWMLLSTWVWEALQRDDQTEALWRLASRSGKYRLKTDPAALPDLMTVEETRTTLGEACAQALLRYDYHSAVILTSLLAQLVYLSRDSQAELALGAYQNLTDWFASHKISASPHAEFHAQNVARFLTYHISHAHIVKPALVRSALEPLLALFSDNTILLSLYAANEARFSIDDRVRGIMQQSILYGADDRSIAGWSFAIHYETLRGEIAGSTSHSIRALYKRATHSEASGAHCPAVWSSYLYFELTQLDLERERVKGKKPGRNGKKRTWERRLDEVENRVKETFYAGLRALPWCKDFIMLAFTDVRGVFGEEEMWKIYRVMGEKELRVYVEFE